MSKEEKQTKKKPKWLFIILGAVVAIILLVLLLGGDDGSDDYIDDTLYESSEDYSSENTDEDTDIANSDSDDSDSNDSDYGEDVSAESHDFTSESEFPLGTADKLEGTTVVMSIVANEANTGWDLENPEDIETLQYLSREFALGLDWIVEQGKAYGKDIKFIYNWDDDQELFYTAELSEDYNVSDQDHRQEVKTFIDENLSSYANKLMAKYNADNIIFVYYFNLPESTDFICHACNFQGTELGMDYPIETIAINKYVYGAAQGPATYAHEVLHLFGAPDFYNVDYDGANYGITQEFSDYCMNEHPNEIMCATYDPYTNTIPIDHVSNELTDLTAYYIGWIDSCEDVEQYGVANSEH